MTLPTGRPHGGPRPGAGRPRNPWRNAVVAMKVNAEAANDKTGKKYTPLDFLIKNMRDETLDLEFRYKNALAAAPFVHARLSSVEVKDENQRLTIEFIDFTKNNTSNNQATIHATPTHRIATSVAVDDAEADDADQDAAD
jgi:hypothetical protein